MAEARPGASARRLGWMLALLVFVGDQVAKWAITVPLALSERPEGIELLPVFRLIWVENRGVSMGMLTADTHVARWLLTAMTAVIAIIVGFLLGRERRTGEAIGLGLVFGGAIGNIVDRVRLGYVADFLNLHFGAWSPFLVFNLADVAISIGVALLVVRAFLVRDARPPAEKLDG